MSGVTLCECYSGQLFTSKRSISVYLRVNSTTQCKFSAAFNGLVTPKNVAFDELMHFDFAVDSQRQDAYYFIRIAIMAYDVGQPEVKSEICCWGKSSCFTFIGEIS